MSGLSLDQYVCQACFQATDRLCSECGVCLYCSEACEHAAETLCHSRIACALHRERALESKVDLGSGATPIIMMERTPVKLVPASHRGTPWQTLMYGATHNLQYLIASSSQTVSKKTSMGMSVVVTEDNHFSAGRQRLHYLNGKTSDGATAIVRNMSNLALAQLGATHKPKRTPFGDQGGSSKARAKKKKAHAAANVHDVNDGKWCVDFADGTANQACIVSGLVVKEGLHFDAIFLTRKDDAWTIHGVQPLWLQYLTPNGGDEKKKSDDFTMNFKMDGYAPYKPRHPLSLLEGALTRAPPPAPAPAPRAQPPASASSTPSPLQLPEALAGCPPPPPDPEDLPTASEASTSSSLRLPPHLQAALEAAEESQDAPQWTAQLQEALRAGHD